MLQLAMQYDTDIMWCDIGGPNKTLEFAAQFYNHAASQGRQVTMNNRCGTVPDFDTREYATFGAIQTRKWESSEGMDSNSYGYNSATPDDKCKNSTTIIRAVVNIASKNGNYLLDIGPMAEGDIIEPMRTGLLETGAWLKHSGACLYDTSYWFPGSQDINASSGTLPSRFLKTPSRFCFVAFSQPDPSRILVINKRLPLLTGDTIVLLRPNGKSEPLIRVIDDVSGQLSVNLTGSGVEQVEHAWAFEATYKLDD
ncbi:alpha-L-fucosidase-domain-containing protein [Mycena floridula]|nr:alpha-L-fucosidase-domain-containing protein [Mycena floridula]